MFKVGQVIKVDGEKTEVLGIVKYSNPLPEYSVKLNNNKCWLEPVEPDKGWRLWEEVSGKGNPVVEAVKNFNIVNLTKYGNFYISSHGMAVTSEAIDNTWGVKVGEKVELWRGKNVTDKEWPLFIVERNKDGITLWVGRHVSVT